MSLTLTQLVIWLISLTVCILGSLAISVWAVFLASKMTEQSEEFDARACEAEDRASDALQRANAAAALAEEAAAFASALHPEAATHGSHAG